MHKIIFLRQNYGYEKFKNQKQRKGSITRKIRYGHYSYIMMGREYVMHQIVLVRTYEITSGAQRR